LDLNPSLLVLVKIEVVRGFTSVIATHDHPLLKEVVASATKVVDIAIPKVVATKTQHSNSVNFILSFVVKMEIMLAMLSHQMD
jgi:hypothetical protein